jgi:hypothetical protein
MFMLDLLATFHAPSSNTSLVIAINLKAENSYRSLHVATLHFQEKINKNICFPGPYFFIIWFVRLLALRPLLAYCASLGW